MRISALSPVIGYQKQGKQKDNINFSSRLVLGKDVENFKLLFPEAVSLTDPELYSTHWHGFGRTIIPWLENSQDRYLAEKCKGSLKDKHLSGEVPYIFITPEEKNILSEKLTNAERELVADSRDMSEAFMDRWNTGEGFFGVLKSVLDCFTDAEPIKASEMEPFVRKIEIIQRTFALAHSGVVRTLETLRGKGILPSE